MVTEVDVEREDQRERDGGDESRGVLEGGHTHQVELEQLGRAATTHRRLGLGLGLGLGIGLVLGLG